MKLSNEQKLLAMLLVDIHEKLGIQNGMDVNLVKEALWANQEWAIEWQHSGVFHEGETPDHVEHVARVLDMWTLIEEAYAQLSASEKETLAAAAEPFGTQVSWPGFDGNEEGEYMSAARILIDFMNRFTHFAGRSTLNSHFPTVDSSERMLSVFTPIRARLGIERRHLNLDELIEILRSKSVDHG